MSNKVLYFPYINVPSSAWFTRMLLYWDNVATIVPTNYMYNPEKFDDYTRSLLKEKLLEHIFPAQYTFGIPDFAGSFIEIIEPSDDLTRRQKLFKEGKTVKIHAEKLDKIALTLKDLQLAEPQSIYGWWNIEKNTADEFMCYLAAFLGRHPDLDYVPITDQIRSLLPLAAVDSQVTNIDHTITELRIQVLEKALPSPRSALSPYEILKFKETHGTELSRFRLKIERELTLLADFNDISLQQKSLNLLKETIELETAEIVGQMKSHGWSDTVFGKLCPFLGAFPVIGAIPKIVNAVYKVFDKTIPSPKFFRANCTTIFCGCNFKQLQYTDTISPFLG